MDKQEKKPQLSIRNNFLKWLNIEGLDSALFIVGNIITGKSTACHLLKRVVDNYDDPKLKFVAKKKQFEYEYDGEINPKATKPLTIYPKLYRIQKNDTNIIEVPSKLYMLEKKRPNLDRLIATVGIAYAAKHAKFLFFVDAKNTAGKIDHWKKSFPQLLDSFDEQFFDETTLDSMGFVFTKAKPKESDKEAYLGRIPDLCKSFTDEDPRKDLYLNLIKNIQKNKRVGVFTKYSDQAEAAHKQIKAIADLYGHLSYANMVTMKDGEQKHMLKKQLVELSKDEQILYNNFKQTLELILNFFADLYFTVFTTNGLADIKNFFNQRSDSLKTIFDKISSQSDKQQGDQSKILNERFNQLKQLSTGKNDSFQSTLGKCLFFVDYKQRVLTPESFNYKNLSVMLDVMFEHGLLIKGFEDQLKPLYMELILFSLFQTRFGPLIANFDFKGLHKNYEMRRAFCEENEEFIKNSLLNSQFSSNQRPDTVKRILSSLDRLFPQSQSQDSVVKEKLEQIKQILSMSTFDTSCPEKGIPQIYEQINNLANVEKLADKIYANTLENPQKDIAYMNKLALLLAQMLKNYGRVDLCAGIFRDSGNYLDAKECLEKRLIQIKESRESAEVTEPILMSYIDLLIEMWLPETAMIQCHQYAKIHKELRPKLLQKMKEIKQRYSQPFSKDFQQKFTGQGVKLFDFFKNHQLLEKIQKLANELQR